jgi:hypothetical protein
MCSFTETRLPTQKKREEAAAAHHGSAGEIEQDRRYDGDAGEEAEHVLKTRGRSRRPRVRLLPANDADDSGKATPSAPACGRRGQR